MEEKYLLGLDLGTNSVGFCLTNQNYEVIRRSGKSLWGVRLFDEAKDCKERRTARSQTRRLKRRRDRILLLQSLFNVEISKTDPSFFQRLELSKYHFEDRKDYFNTVQTLFVDKNYNDKHYYKDYPTIYHLRKKLLETKEKQDIRLIYLAIHHAIKYRGNFLSAGQTFSVMDQNEIKELFESLNENLALLNKEVIPFDNEKFEKIKAYVKNIGSISRFKEFLTTLFDLKDNYVNKIVLPMIAGSKLNAFNVFELEEENEDVKKLKICFNEESFDETIEELKNMLDDEVHTNIVLTCKGIYNFIKIGKILKDKNYISYAMVEKYESHKKDLNELKAYFKTISSDAYNSMFRNYDDKVNNYVKYVGSNRVANKGERFKKCSRDDFYKHLRSVLGISANQTIDDPFLSKINDKMTEGDYLDKQNSTDNGVFPYQLNQLEIEKIIENQSQYYPFFYNCDEDNLTIKEKIISILSYQIPYYIGPLAYNKSNPSFSWCVRKIKDCKIYPWNIKKVIDYEKTSEVFITRMLNRCTYFPEEYCLPKNSITFSMYSLLNELNKISINRHAISFEDKKDIIDNLFKKGTVSKKTLQSYIKNKYGQADTIITTSNDKELEEVKTNLKSFNTFASIFGEDYVNKNIETIDNIIRDITLFTDKKVLEKRLSKDYGIKDEAIIKRILTLNYQGYGRLSRKVIDGITTPVCDISTGEVKDLTILDIMYQTNKNFMEIINDSSYNFRSIIEQENKQEDSNKTIDEYVNELYVNPTMKRPLIQAYKIIEELKKIINHPIDEFYIECTRSNMEEKVRKLSRREQLIDLYSNIEIICKQESKNANKGKKDNSFEIEYIKNNYLSFINENKESLRNRPDTEFRSDKLYLYYLQLGRCMYTNKPISLKDLNRSELYDIDHIIPQSKVKDDSVENRVLVCQDINRRKTDEFPIPRNVLFEGHKSFYKMLKNNKLMGEKKFNNLLRLDDLSNAEIESFVNRQLVSTNQAVSGLFKVIKHFENMDETKIIYSKAENVSLYRQKFKIVKCRDINDYHHAHDAFLNIVVGRTLNTYFGYRGDVKRLKELKENNKTLNIKNIFDHNVKDYAGNIVYDKNETIKRVKEQIFKRTDAMFTTRQYVGNIILNKIGIVPAKASKGDGSLFPLKSPVKQGIESCLSDTTKYGGYPELSNGFYTLVSSQTAKGKEIISIESMQNIYVSPYASVDKKVEYLTKIKGLINPKVIIPLLRINTLIESGKSKFCITGKTGNKLVLKNTKQVFFDENEIKIIKKIVKLQDTLVQKKLSLQSETAKIEALFPIDKTDNSVIISPKKNNDVEEIRLSWDEEGQVYSILQEKLNKDIFDFYSPICKARELLSNPEKKEMFNNFDLFKRAYVLLQILKLLKCNRELSDFKLIDESPAYGNIFISKNLGMSLKIINESVTGFYRKVVYEYKGK